MTKNFIQKAFDRWLSGNRNRFRFQPVIVRRCKDYIQLHLTGISQKIECVITRHCADVGVNHKGECWDILTSFEVEERKSSAGYYCKSCAPDTRELFATREELWIKHCFELLLDWINENFDESRWVYLFATEGITRAEIKEKDDGILENKDFVHAFPVIERMNRRQ